MTLVAENLFIKGKAEKIRKSMCAECVYNTRSKFSSSRRGISADLVEGAVQSYLGETDCYVACHTEVEAGKHRICCKGFYNKHKE